MVIWGISTILRNQKHSQNTLNIMVHGQTFSDNPRLEDTSKSSTRGLIGRLCGWTLYWNLHKYPPDDTLYQLEELISDRGPRLENGQR